MKEKRRTVVCVWSGERVVVFLVIVRVLSSVRSASLLLESVSLTLLVIAAFAVEVLVDGSEFMHFQTRRGASSGILLGTISIPLVMLSQLIRLSHEVESRGLGDFSIQYWSASVGGLVALIFLALVLCNQKESRQPFLFGKLSFASYAAVCFLSLAASCHSRYCTAMKAFWVCCHALATVGLMRHILLTFPFCASIGEALVAANGLVLYLSDALFYTLTKVESLSYINVLQHGARRSQISTFIQGVLVGLLLLPTSYKYLLQTWGFFTSHVSSENAKNGVSEGVHKSVVFYALLGLTLTVFAPAWMYFVHDFKLYPILWAFEFVFTKSMNRVFLCLYWLVVICLSIVRFYKISKHSLVERILLRKYYHLVAVLMFVPAVVLEPEFLDMAFGAALAVFLVVEIIRVWRIWPFGELVHKFMNAFTDHRDSDLLIVSHFSLLLGCALPKWMSSGLNDRPLAPFAGILSLGIGDTMVMTTGQRVSFEYCGTNYIFTVNQAVNISDSRAMKPFEIVHSDVSSPCSTLTIIGHHYFVTFIDNYSRFTVIYLMKSKNEVESLFSSFHKLVENQFQAQVKILRSHNEGEFMSSTLRII